MYIVCVTACPVGIAHTYMAAANLEKAFKHAGHEVKVETEEDLTRADAALIASDIRIKNVERFKDIPTMTVAVQEAVKDPDGIVSELMEALE